MSQGVKKLYLTSDEPVEDAPIFLDHDLLAEIMYSASQVRTVECSTRWHERKRKKCKLDRVAG